MPPIDNDAWPELLPAIRRQTLVIADRLNMTPATRDEFLGDAVAWIREKENLFDGSRGSLGAWCATVLRNRGVDLIRRHSAASAAREKYDQDTRAEQESRIRRARRDDEPDAPPAIDVIAVLERHVDADNRIFVAIDCRLLGEFDPQQVAGWIAEAGLPEGFPWREIEAIEKKAERRKALAAAIGENDGWLRQRIFRALERLHSVLGDTR